MRILVTGATGFIGRTLVLRALSDRAVGEVVAPVRSPEKLRAQLAREGLKDPVKLRVIKAEAPRWDLREAGAITGYNAPFGPRDRSAFVEGLEMAVRRAMKDQQT